MTKETKFTPTPWNSQGGTVYGRDNIRHQSNVVAYTIDDQIYRDDEEGKANAAHIVHCVNVHDELVVNSTRMRNKLRVIKDLVNQGDETDATIKAIKAAVEDI